MSKMDNLRAMREARFEAARAAARAATKPPEAAADTRSTASVAAAVAGRRTVEAVLCAHPSKDGRSCIREAGHAAKTHRYA